MKLKKYFSASAKWKKGEFWDGKDARCLSGAIGYCYQYDIDTYWNVRKKIDKYCYAKLEKLGEEEISRLNTIPQWNDHKSTTFNDIRTLVEELDV